jgi:hypothetical protein
MSKPITPAPVATRPKSAPDKWAIAGRLGRKLEALDAEEKIELAASPATIRKKYEERRAKALDGADDDVRELVAKMRGEEQKAAE